MDEDNQVKLYIEYLDDTLVLKKNFFDLYPSLNENRKFKTQNIILNNKNIKNIGLIGDCFLNRYFYTEIIKNKDTDTYNFIKLSSTNIYNPISLKKFFDFIENGESIFIKDIKNVYDSYWCPYLNFKELYKNKNSIIDDINKAYKYSSSSMREIDSVLISVMNTEVWHENNTNIYFNVTPPPELIKKKNCSVKCLNVNETAMLLESVYKSIKKQNKKLLIMINPITIHATFTDKDVRIADNISKSTMMIAIHQLIEKYNDIIYIPVYDFYLKITDKTLYLHEDGRHINNYGIKILTKYIIDFIDECKLK